FLKMRTIDDRPIDPNVARGAALAVGVVNGLAAQFGLKYIGKAFGPLLQKFGGGKAGQVALEKLIGKAIGNPEFQSVLAKIGNAGFTGAAVNAGFAFINKLAEGVATQAIATKEEGVPFPAPNDILKDAWDDATSLEGTLAPGFFLGVGGATLTHGIGVMRQRA